MKTTVFLLLLALLQLTATAQPIYGERSDGTTVLLGSRDNTGGTAVFADPLIYHSNTHGALTLSANRSSSSGAPPAGGAGTPTSTATNAPVSIALGDSVSVSWTNNTFFTFFDWVGLYLVGAPDSQFIERRFVIGSNQEVVFSPPALGTYEVRYIKWNGERWSTYGPVEVKTTLQLMVNLERTLGGILINVTWPTKAGRTYVVYVSLNLKNWEPMVLVNGTGSKASIPVPLSGQVFYKVLEH